MKKERISRSRNGSENIAKIITMYASKSCTDIIKHLDVQILPESYINEIEQNIKEMKKQKVKSKRIYTFKQGTLEGYANIKN